MPLWLLSSANVNYFNFLESEILLPVHLKWGIFKILQVEFSCAGDFFPMNRYDGMVGRVFWGMYFAAQKQESSHESSMEYVDSNESIG